MKSTVYCIETWIFNFLFVLSGAARDSVCCDSSCYSTISTIGVEWKMGVMSWTWVMYIQNEIVSGVLKSN